VFVAERLWGFDVFGAQAEALEHHLVGSAERRIAVPPECPPAA